jgi:hypothetical protein
MRDIVTKLKLGVHASLLICLSILVSKASTTYFWQFFEKCRKSMSETAPETSNCYVTEMLRWISSFLRQSLVLVRRYRNIELDVPQSNTKRVTIGGILKIGVTFCSNSAFCGERLAARRQSSSRGAFPSSLATKPRTVDFWRIFENTGSGISETGFR